MRPIVVITHAAFDEQRRAMLPDLVAQVRAHGFEPRVAHDYKRNGTLWCWREAMVLGLDSDATHVVQLPDDAILCPNFGNLLRAAISARAGQVFDCYANYKYAPQVKSAWYTTPDGYVGLGGCIPTRLLKDVIAWREFRLGGRARPDEGVNLWAMATHNQIWKTTRSLVNHRSEVASLAGNDDHFWRTAATFSDGSDEDWSAEPHHAGRTYNFNHWGLMVKVRPPMTARAYEVEKDVPRAC